MQVNTLIRLGSLAFDVVQDDKVRELVNMVHQGGKRRGLWAQPNAATIPPNGSNSSSTQSASTQTPKANVKSPTKKETPQMVPFGPAWTQMPAWTKMPEAKGLSLPAGVGKYLTSDNAKKALKMAGGLGQFLIK